ncbi:MAG TPA: ring-cleaving dioxygenase [Chloroflexota bacterium]|nr:ring-cleaving dioxygenase [Chloroflexota bacterium]
MELGGIHHITAVSGSGPRNLDFYTRVLGLRLIKKTVNQDVPSTYHLFYGDEVGTPGTEMTFFEWPDVPAHVSGSGDVSAIGFAVPGEEALDWWRRRFDAEGVRYGQVEERHGRPVLPFTDPEGQRLQLIAGERPGITPWRNGPVPVEHAIRGFGTVTLTARRLEPTQHVLRDVMGFRAAGEYVLSGGERVFVFETGAGGLGTEVHLAVQPGLRPAQTGIGGVHHVAFRTPDDEQHRQWQQHVARAGLNVTPVIDRYYFRALYFREPGGVLFEISTDGPGFATDEDVAHLGEKLSLPPFLEPHRAEIEAVLPPLELVGVRT